MTKEKTLAILLVLALVGVIWWLVTRQTDSPSVYVSEAELARFVDATKIEFSSESGDKISVEFVGDLARVSGGEYNGVVMRQIVAASGAKYEGESGVTLWTKGDEVRIETPQNVVYVGVAVPKNVEVATVPEPIVEELGTTTSSTTALASLTDSVWVWDYAEINAEKLIPKKEGVFALEFNTEGHVNGKTDCNSFGGSYQKEDNGIVFGEFMSTLMFCDGSEESTFTALLNGSVEIVTLSESNLVLQNKDKSKIYFTKQ